jgi:hypothetical protein
MTVTGKIRKIEMREADDSWIKTLKIA